MQKNSFQISGNIVDVISSKIYKGTIFVENGIITKIEESQNNESQYIIPGFIDAHVHIESSMLTPAAFARQAVIHGTIATVSDPHEIANVLGIDGVKFMIENGKKVPFHFSFGTPSCVPATPFETSGATLGLEETETLMAMPEIKYMGEMMNFPGVLFEDELVKAKIAIAKKYNKPIDGHAPGLAGDSAKKYLDAGISTDHECFSIDEAKEKIAKGMKIQIREGSAAKNLDELMPLIEEFTENVMLCSDDKHPDDLIKGHINLLAKRAVAYGIDPIKVLQTITLNPIRHYGLEVGLLQKGDAADFIIVDDLKDFNVKQTYIQGLKVAENNESLIPSIDDVPANVFHAGPIRIEDLTLNAESNQIRVIQAHDGQLITSEVIEKAKILNNTVVSDTENDILKIVVINRYEAEQKPSIAFIRGFGLKKGAIASTVAHDSHNIIAVGSNDEDLMNAINGVVECKGGIAACCGSDLKILPLPYAGLMSGDAGEKVAKLYEEIDAQAKSWGSTLKSPFMTLSFMALLVIPSLKISDKGLFDGEKFEFTQIFC